MNVSLRFSPIRQRNAPYSIRVLLVWIGSFFFVPTAKGQEAREAFCPTGSTVTLDTIVFVPDKPLPFDRCFFLVVTQSATSTVDRFALTPLGKQGQNNFKIRDRNILLRSTYPDKEKREDAKKQTTVTILNENPFGKPLKITKRVVKGDKVDLYLHITPLDPGREYRITLIGRDNTAFNDVLNISSTIIESKRASIASQTAAAVNLLDQARRANAESIANAKTRNTVRFSRGTIADYERRITQFTLDFDLATLDLSKLVGSRKPDVYKLLFVPGNALLDSTTAINNSNGRLFLGKNPPHSFLVTLPTKDTNGDTIKPFSSGTYCLQLLAIYEPKRKSFFRKFFKKSPSNQNNTYSLLNLGKLELLTDPAFAYKFTPDPQTSTDVFIGLDEDNPLALLSTIKSTSATIAQLPASLTISCLDTAKTHATLGFLLEQASICPCVEKGIKDLTQKDDLMRTISLLYDKDAAILGNSLSGLKSLKAPAVKAADAENYQTRSDNLSTSISLLNDLMEFARKEVALHGADAARIRALLVCLQELRDQMVSIKGSLNAQLTARAKLQDKFTIGFGLLTTESITQGSTSVFNFLSEAKFQISPDFGFVALFKGSKSYAIQDFTPYLGFQVGFRPIDKNIPFRLIHNKSLWHRLSFMSGVTLTSLKIDNQRTDFFDKYSLITGLGFRMGNYLRATTGLVWFKAVDPNQLSANKPARFSPFVGLSVDFELQDLFGGIAKLFK